MDRKFVIALSSLAGSMMLTEAHAIGLGEIKLHTALNEPLRADIQLVQVKDLSEGEILINLAPKADFDRAGVERDFLLSSLRFRLDLDDPKHPKIVVTTQQPIREPFVDFLVEVQWPSGRLLREYTLLMDLPAFAESGAGRSVTNTNVPSGKSQASNSAPVSSADGVRVRRASRNELGSNEGGASSVEGKMPAPESRAPVRERAQEISADQYGPTRSSDTLWKIAQSVRNGGNVHQNMVAIQKLNPGAFANGNINLLKKGQVLKLPAREDIASIGRAEAVAIVNEQNVAWKNGKNGKVEGAQLDATSRAGESATAPTQTEGQLKIAAPAAASDGKSGQGAAGEAAAGQQTDPAALQSQLATSQEELNRIQREKEQLAAKADNLHGQVENQQRLLELQNSEMANMQSKLAAEQQAKAAAGGEQPAPVAQTDAAAPAQPDAAPAAQPDAAQPSAEQAGEVATSAEPVASEPPAEKPAEPAAEAQPAPAAEPAPAATQPEAKGGFSSLISGFAIVVAVLLGLFGYRRMAHRAGEEAEKSIDVGIDYVPVSVGAPAAAETPVEEPAFEVVAPKVESAPVAAPAEAPKPETGDVLGEADIYISFGNFEKGEALLKSAISGEPGRIDFRLKLLELYKESGDLAAYDAAYKELLDLDDDQANAKAAEMRSRIAGADAAPFAFGIAAAAEAMGSDFDLDLSVSPVEDVPAADEGLADLELDHAAAPEALADDFDLGFDLELDAPAPVSAPAEELAPVAEPAVEVAAAPAPEVDDLDLDFNLDTDSSASVVTDAPAVEARSSTSEESLLGDDDLGFMSDADEAATKLDLARAYIDMGDRDGARDILAEVLEEGLDEQKQEAQALLDSIG